jgi:hypothetical protein
VLLGFAGVQALLQQDTAAGVCLLCVVELVYMHVS